MEEQTNKGIGPIAGTIIIIIVLIVGAFYFFGQRVEKQKQAGIQNQQNPIATTSDEIGTLQSDVNSLNVDKLGNSVNNL